MTRDGEIVEHHYIEHYPPDPTSCIFWLKNRRPDRWRDMQNIEAELGHYVISETPISPEDWIKQHADVKVIDHEASPKLRSNAPGLAIGTTSSRRFTRGGHCRPCWPSFC